MENKETNPVKDLKEKLFMSSKTGMQKISKDEVKKADDFCVEYKKFLDFSRTERDAVEYAVALAEKNGFVEFSPENTYKAGDRVYVNNRGKALMLAVIGKKGVKEGANLSIAHIDSPRIDLKPRPLYEANNLALFKTHYYGGLKKYQWTTLPLTLHGSVVKLDGT